MEYIAIAKNIKISPRKVRLVVASVKKKNLSSANAVLSVMNKRAAIPIRKAIDSAIANAVNNFKADKTNLTIRDVIVSEGVSMKRYHFAARGRTRPYKRRTSHIRVILSDNIKSEARSPKHETKSKQEIINKEKEVNNGTKS